MYFTIWNINNGAKKPSESESTRYDAMDRMVWVTLVDSINKRRRGMNQGRKYNQERFSEIMTTVGLIGVVVSIVGLVIYNLIVNGI